MQAVVFIPLSDDNPLRSIRFQWVTVGLIAANVLVFLLADTPDGQAAMAPASPWFPPSCSRRSIFGGAVHWPYDSARTCPRAARSSPIMFLHGDILHLLSNMLFLWVFGDNVEDAMGHVKYLVFYLVCGIAGGLAHRWMLPTSKLPLIGASGAVAGVIAAYLILHPRVLVWVLAFRFIPLRISAAWVLGVWVATQFIMIVLSTSPTRWRGGRTSAAWSPAPFWFCSCAGPAFRCSTAGISCRA